MERSKISVAVGESRVNLACVADGDRPINVKWTKVREQLTQYTRKIKKNVQAKKLVKRNESIKCFKNVFHEIDRIYYYLISRIFFLHGHFRIFWSAI